MAVRPPDHTRTSWPDLVGYPDVNAGLIIAYDRPDLRHVEFYDVGLNGPVGSDLTRAVVFRDPGTRIVVYPPYVG
ncbi:hypothetical protein BRADI_3g02390v3 [Brachypodium distachyon]|uniref:Uncharacterized protein n=1 Tax=Brachypodium distachyon TaxID=15368 RepID=I1HWN8_BRADI|nr:hypothetical protein BRADI_3g02390v3 [Brachypodium distachyon]